MTAPQKIMVSFLLSAFLCSGIAFFAYTGFWDVIESRFYNSSVTDALVRETAMDAQVLSGHLAGLQSRFSHALHNPAVYRSFLRDQAAADIYERSRVFGLLQESVAGFRSARLVGPDGVRIHYSTDPQDILSSDSVSIRYRDYNEGPVPLKEQIQLVADKAGGRVVFFFPLHDTPDIYRGTALLTVSAGSLTESLIAAGRMDAAENLVLCAASVGGAGIVRGLPGIPGGEVLAGVSETWANGYRNIVPFISGNAVHALVSVRADQGFYYGRIVNEEVFVFPPWLRTLTYTAIFLTVFLTIFLLFNLKQRPPAARQEHIEPKKNPGLSVSRRKVPPVNPRGFAIVREYKEEYLEELERVPDPAHGAAAHGQGLLATAALLDASPPSGLQPGARRTGNDGSTPGVIYEQDGVPYISDDAFNSDKNTEEKLNNNFVQLIESVVTKKLPPSAPRNQNKPEETHQGGKGGSHIG